MRRPLPFALAVLAGVALDQAAKLLVFGRLGLGESFQALPGLLHVTPALNPGVAFSLFRGHPAWILAITAAVAGIVVAWYVRSWRAAPGLLVASQGLLLAGAGGNLIDRLRAPYQVRDFIDFIPPLPLIGKWAIFNVADVFICTGVGLLLLAEITGQPRGAEKKE